MLAEEINASGIVCPNNCLSLIHGVLFLFYSIFLVQVVQTYLCSLHKLVKTFDQIGIFSWILYMKGEKIPAYQIKGKEANSMGKPSLDKETVEHQFDTLIKKVLIGEAKNIKSALSEYRIHELLFSELSAELTDSFGTCDEHPCECFCFRIYEFDIAIKNELLAEAVVHLSERKRNIILMSYFLDMSDQEIARRLELVRSTVTYHRESALVKLKKYMEENDR